MSPVGCIVAYKPLHPGLPAFTSPCKCRIICKVLSDYILFLVRFLCLFEKRVERSLKRDVCNNDLVCNRHMSLSVPTFCLESKRMHPTQTATR